MLKLGTISGAHLFLVSSRASGFCLCFYRSLEGSGKPFFRKEGAQIPMSPSLVNHESGYEGWKGSYQGRRSGSGLADACHNSLPSLRTFHVSLKWKVKLSYQSLR
jgi:hypothetical protein